MNTVRKIFLALFIFSTLGVLVLFLNLRSDLNFPASVITQAPSPTKTPEGTQNPDVAPTASTSDPEVDPSSQNSKDIGLAALLGSVITSVTSLIGFVTTTIISWRREKREASLADMQHKKLETELERSRLELERLKKSRTKKSKK